MGRSSDALTIKRKKDRQTDEGIDGWMGGQMDGQMDEQSGLYSPVNATKAHVERDIQHFCF